MKIFERHAYTLKPVGLSVPRPYNTMPGEKIVFKNWLETSCLHLCELNTDRQPWMSDPPMSWLGISTPLSITRPELCRNGRAISLGGSAARNLDVGVRGETSEAISKLFAAMQISDYIYQQEDRLDGMIRSETLHPRRFSPEGL